MQLDTRLPLAAAAQAPITFQPESRMQTLSRVAPGINAMRQMQAQEAELADAARKRQAFRQFQNEVSKAFPGGVRELAQVFMTQGVTPQHFETGQKLMQMALEEDERGRIFGGGGAPAAAMPAQMTAPAAPTTMKMPVSEVAPETNLGAAGGARPRNAMMAMEAPAPAARATAPAGMMEYANKQYSPDQVSQMLQSRNAQLQQLGRAIADANKPQRETQPEKLRMMQALGYPMTQEGFAAFEAAQRSPQLSTDYQNYQQAQKEGYKGNFFQYQQELRKAGASSVGVNLPLLEKQEQKDKGALNVKEFEGIASAARIAARTLPAIETQERVLNAGFQTGFGAEAKKIAASILSALGVPEAERFASNAETFVAAMNQSVLQRQLEQKGPQTEADAQRISATGAQLGNTVQGNRFIIAVAKAQLKRDISQRRFWEEYWRKNKTYEGAEEAWQSGPGGKSLFDAPELREFVRATTPPSAPQTGGAGAARPGGGGSTARPSGGGVDRNNPLLRKE